MIKGIILSQHSDSQSLRRMDLSIYPWNLLEPPFLCVFFTTAGSYFELYFVFLMSSGSLVGLFTGSPKGSQGNKRTWLPGMAASQTYKGRHKEVFNLIYSQRNIKLKVKQIKMLFLVYPSYGLCFWQIPADASSPFLRQAFGASQENEPHPAWATTERQNTGTK